MNTITKSGTNGFHGDAFEFLRNVFNVRNTFSDPTAKDHGRDQLKRNQFGGTFGGPIIPAAAKVLAFIPLGDAQNNINFSRPDRRNTDEVVGKLDHALRQSDRLELRAFYARFQRDPVFNPTNILTYNDGSTINNQNYLIHESHLFSSTMINDFRFSFAREIAERGPASNVPSVADFGVNIFQPSAGKAIQSINVQGSGGFSFGDNPHAVFARNNFTWSDDVAWTKGQHDIRFGGVLERSRVDLNNPGFFGYGTFTFSSFANFQKGILSQFQQGAGEFKNNRGLFTDVYLQDNYKVSRRLTLNLGVRYEPGLPWREDKDRIEQFRLSQAIPGGQRSAAYPNAPPGLFFVGDAGMPKNGVDASLNNIAPRVGFAYDVTGDGNTSLRGGPHAVQSPGGGRLRQVRQVRSVILIASRPPLKH